jgi:polysaccharide export outer membrane protein
MIVAVRRVLDWSMAKHFWILPLLLWGITPAYGQDKVETPKQTNEKIFQLAGSRDTRPVETPIGAGDVIHIDVFDVPELGRDLRVSDTGDISLPLIPGRIHAAGLTTFELEAKVENLLVENGLVTHPQVSVFIKEQLSQPISVVGAVAHPMVMQIVRPTTLLEVLALAGGLADDAGAVVLVTHGSLNPEIQIPNAPAKPVVQPQDAAPKGGGQDPLTASGPTESVRLKDLLVSGDPTFNIPVYGGDVVSVPRSGIVYVIGAVNSPGGYVLETRGDKISVLKIIAMAHGWIGSAKPNDAVIERQDPKTGAKQEIPAPLKKMLQRKADDMALQAGDMLYVPDSTAKRVAGKVGEAALIAGTGAVFYRLP